MIGAILMAAAVLGVEGTPQYPAGMPSKIIQMYEEKASKTDMGEYELTAYIATGNCCADGRMPSVGYTVACNDKRLWHKTIEIEGYGVYYVHDTGGMTNNVIDIFTGSYDEAIHFGRRRAKVYIINEGE